MTKNIYVPVLDSILVKLTVEEKANLQASLDSYETAGYSRGYDDGYTDAATDEQRYYD